MTETEMQQQPETQSDIPKSRPINPNHAYGRSAEIQRTVLDIFEYHAWTPEQIERGRKVRTALENAFLEIIENVPPCPDRTVALRKLREVRMDCNSAITHNGKY